MSVDFLPKLTGCFAMPAAENPTVAMVEAAYRHHNIHARYITCEVAPALLGDAVRGAAAMGWIGFNCSLPHKVAVIDHLDALGDSAALIGAVNTVVRRENRWIGENTDGRGFVESLRAVADPAGKTIVLFGAGGAARAVAVELALAGARRIVVVNRSEARAAPLVALINEKTKASAELAKWPSGYRIPGDADIVINATSIGLFPDVGGRPDIDADSLAPSIGRRRSDPESAPHDLPSGGCCAWLPDDRRAWHAGQPGRARNQVLDRSRRRSCRHAQGAGGRARRLSAARPGERAQWT